MTEHDTRRHRKGDHGKPANQRQMQQLTRNARKIAMRMKPLTSAAPIYISPRNVELGIWQPIWLSSKEALSENLPFALGFSELIIHT